MKSFAEFLKEKEDEVRSAEAARAKELSRWVRSIDELNAQAEAWLKASDPNSLLHFTKRPYEITESQVGAYTTERLEIWLGGRVISLVPIARYVRGPVLKPGNGDWTGRVDLTDGEFRYEIFRFTHSDSNEGWFVRNGKYPLVPFTKETLEQFVMIFCHEYVKGRVGLV